GIRLFRCAGAAPRERPVCVPRPRPPRRPPGRRTLARTTQGAPPRRLTREAIREMRRALVDALRWARWPAPPDRHGRGREAAPRWRGRGATSQRSYSLFLRVLVLAERHRSPRATPAPSSAP